MMFLGKYLERGCSYCVGAIACAWLDHPVCLLFNASHGVRPGAYDCVSVKGGRRIVLFFILHNLQHSACKSTGFD